MNLQWPFLNMLIFRSNRFRLTDLLTLSVIFWFQFLSIKKTIMILSSDEHQTHQKNFNFHSLHPKLDSMSIGSSRSNLASPLHFQQRAARVASPLPFQQPYVPYGSSHQVSSAVTTHTRFNGFHTVDVF